MPVIVPLVAAVAGALAASAIGTGIVAALVGAFVTFAVSALGNALFGAKKKTPAAVSDITGRDIQARESAAPHRHVIGTVKVSGPLNLMHVQSADGQANKYFWLGLVLAAHEVDGWNTEDIWIDDAPLTDPKFSGLVTWWGRFGKTDQSAIPEVVASIGDPEVWSNDHRGRGRAYIILRLAYSESVFGGAIPNVAVVLRGKKLLDPRTGLSTFTDNAALAVSDYLLSPSGFGVPVDDIDDDAWVAAANLADERVASVHATGGTVPRYSANGTYTLDRTPAAIMEDLLSASAGAAINAGGTWYIEPAAWRPSNVVIVPDDLRGPVSVDENRPLRDVFNTVRATYVRPEGDWQETDAPVLVDAVAKGRHGQEIATGLELPFTTNGYIAQRLMKIALGRNQAGRPVSVTLPCKLVALQVRPGQVIAVDLPGRPRFQGRVTNWRLDDDYAGITLTLEADSAAIYDWNAAVDESVLAVEGTSTLPGATTTIAPVLTLTPPTAPVPTSIDAGWSAVTGALDYELGWRIGGSGEYTLTTQAGTSATIATGARAEMKVRARGALDWSDYAVAEFPPAVARLVVVGAPGGIHIEWSGPATVQVFTSAGTDFAASTLLGTPSGGVADLSLSAGTYSVWARGVGAAGAVGAETDLVTVVAADPASGGSTGGESGPADGGASDGDGEGGEGGDSGG